MEKLPENSLVISLAGPIKYMSGSASCSARTTVYIHSTVLTRDFVS